MTTTLAALTPEYLSLLASMRVTRSAEVDATARRLVGYVPTYYAAASLKTKIPSLWFAPTGEREDGANIFHSYFGNGDPLTRPTTDVPRGRGPFDSFQAGLLDAVHYDQIDRVTAWDWAQALFQWEKWNGFGPRAHGKHSGYLWAGTSIYTGGKYTSDNHWDPSADDEQLGVVPIALSMVALMPSLALPGAAPSPSPAPTIIPPPIAPPQGVHDAAALQTVLNLLGAQPPLRVDNSYGRVTSAAVRDFQKAHGLVPVDGLAGTDTWAAISSDLAAAS